MMTWPGFQSPLSMMAWCTLPQPQSKHVADAVLRGELPDGGESFGGLLRGGGEVVVEGEGDAGGVLDLRVLHFVFEDLHDEVGAEIVHHHEVDIGDYDVAGTDLFVAARFGENFFDYVHRSRGRLALASSCLRGRSACR